MIGDAAYAAKWYESSPAQSRILLLLIVRSQRRLSITIGKFMDLSLERFTAVRCVPRITFFLTVRSMKIVFASRIHPESLRC